jgi:prepilin-type N-terminal cleavage/methylation domain-containing protein
VSAGRAGYERGFTLLELMVALVILAAAFTVVWSTFSATLKAWERGTKLMDELHNGDYVMEQLVSGLRSMAFFPATPDVYGFWLDPRGGSFPRDEISWVTSGTSFLPSESPLADGLYRLTVSIDDNAEGDPSVAVQAYPHMADPEDRDVEPWYVSSKVKGLKCRAYNFEDEIWEEEWEDTNSIPSLIEISLFMEPLERYGPPVVLQRLIEIPLGTTATSGVSTAAGRVNNQGRTEQAPPANVGAPAGAGPGAIPPSRRRALDGGPS